MSRIFISYARSDVDFARKLARSLSEMGADIWIDVNDIPAGMKWSSAIQQGLNICQIMLLIVSPDSMASNNVEDEWQYYLDKTKPVIPLWYRPADKHFQISRLQHVDFHGLSYHIAFDRLLTELQSRGVSLQLSPADSAAPSPIAAPIITQTPPTTILPAPFAWIDISGKGYSIAKYPITNSQYAKFIEADGYNQRKWWTDAGWTQRTKDKWAQPRYWTDAKWNGSEYPVVGVSWYESVAFCRWLSDLSHEKIMLPTEDQWQYAAQGDEDRAYPWGSTWDASRCNSKVGKKGIRKTTPVRHYEGKGDSPFGVVDMAGNVWEWCLTDYEDKTNDLNSMTNSRVLRGGSWYYDDSNLFRCYDRNWGNTNLTVIASRPKD